MKPERLAKEEPFWLLIACFLEEHVTWDQACHTTVDLRLRWPLPHGLAQAFRRDLATCLSRLPNDRIQDIVVQLRKLSDAWRRHGEWNPSPEFVAQLPHVSPPVATKWAKYMNSVRGRRASQ